MKVIPLLAINSFLQRFADGQVDFSMIPYDYFWAEGSPSQYNRMVEGQTAKDAEVISKKQLLENYGRYSDRFYFLELLTVIKAIDYKNTKHSLKDIAEMTGSGERFDALPSGVERMVQRARQQTRMVSEQRQQFEREKQIVVHDFSLSEEDERKLLEKGADVYPAFLDVVKCVSYPYAEGEVKHAYYQYPNGSIAHAASRQRLKGWNLLGIREMLIQLDRQLGGNCYDADIFWKEILRISTHEDAHIEEKSDHWGAIHSEVFYELQRNVIAHLLYTLDINAVRQQVCQKYKGKGKYSMIDPSEMLEILGIEKKAE